LNSKQNPIQKIKIPDFDEFSEKDLDDFLTNINRLKRGLIIHSEIYIMFTLVTIALSIFMANFILLFFSITFAVVWFIGLGEHLVVYRIKSREVYPKSRRSFYYHLGAFLSSIPIMAFITFLLFVFIPLLIWGTIVLTHYIIYKLMDNNSILKKVESSNYDTTPKYGGFSEAQLRVLAIKKVRFRISVYVHAIIFTGVSVTWNILSGARTLLPLFIIGPWFIALGGHITAYLMFSRGVYPKAKRVFYFHLATFIFAIPLWLPFLPFSAFFLSLWGFILLIHYGLFEFIHFVVHRNSRDSKGSKTSHIQRLVEKEMEKMKREL
jgi:hypothetical protein